MPATIVNANYNGLKTFEDNGDGTGAMHVIVDSGSSSAPSATTSTTSAVPASVTSVQLLAANTARKGASVFNDANVAMYVKFGTGASATDFKTKILAGGYYDFPLPIYTGVVHGIWDAAPTGNARISEET